MVLQKKELIETLASKVNNKSEKYQLVHASSAIENMLNELFKKEYAEKRNEIKNELKKNLTKDQQKNFEKQKLDLEEWYKNRKFYITVDYLPSDEIEAARTVKIRNTLHISIPQYLADGVRTSGNSINYDNIAIIRRLMAHELGHILLHTNAMLDSKGTQGSKLLCGDMEVEADFFAEKLIEKRRERNEEFYRDKGYKKI